MTFHIVETTTPFLWRGSMYLIHKCGMRDGEPYASTIPDAPELVEEIKRRIKADNGLKVYIAAGYTCFIEDYQNAFGSNV